MAVGAYILDNAEWLAERIYDMLTLYSIAALKTTIAWLVSNVPFAF